MVSYTASEEVEVNFKSTSGGRRQYSQQDVEACRVIECLKRSGLSIKEIKYFMDMVAEGDASLVGRRMWCGRYHRSRSLNSTVVHSHTWPAPIWTKHAKSCAFCHTFLCA